MINYCMSSRIKKMADNTNVDSGGQSASPTGGSNPIVSDLNSAVIAQESRQEAGGHENQASRSTNQTKNLSSNSDPEEEMSNIVDIIFELKKMADTNYNNNSEASDSTDLTAAISLLALNSSTQPMAVNQEKRSNNLETCLNDPGPCRGNNALSNKEHIRPVDNVNHNQRYLPGPASRKLAPEACCFIRELSRIEANHDFGRLYLTRDEAETIPSCPKMTEAPKNSCTFLKLMVFDYQNVQWNMMLDSYTKYEGNTVYLFSPDGSWRNFLRAHNLGSGDTILFYKNRDSRVNADDYYYVILFWRLRDGGFKTFLDPAAGKKTSRKL